MRLLPQAVQLLSQAGRVDPGLLRYLQPQEPQYQL